MNVTVLRTYAIQLEEVAKLELAELASALLGSDAGRAYLLLDAAVGDVV